MADVRDLFYHGMRQQIRRVLDAMGPERIDMGLTAFETGMSSWSACFFARAFPEVNLNSVDPERKIAQLLGMGDNRVPMRIVYHTFDGASHFMTKQQLRKFIEDIRDESRPSEVMDLLKQIGVTDSQTTSELDFAGACGNG